MRSRIVVISPHPDDDVIGCGGMMWKRALAGDEVHSIYLSSGEMGGRPEGMSAEDHIKQRENEAAVASEVLQIAMVHFLRAPDQQVNITAWLPERLKALLTRIISNEYGMGAGDIDELYVTHPAELHPDHSGAAAIVRSLLPLLPGVKRALSYEVWTPLPTFDVVEDITAEAGMKRAAIRCHKSQAQNAFEEAALALNHYRGLLHGPGKLYAEVFQSW
jgi:LmbE family N-acetylglucosaminyl deacetylase